VGAWQPSAQRQPRSSSLFLKRPQSMAAVSSLLLLSILEVSEQQLSGTSAAAGPAEARLRAAAMEVPSRSLSGPSCDECVERCKARFLLPLIGIDPWPPGCG
jgi:hypothetical protein